MVRQPTIRDREVRVRAYLTDEAFGYDHWRAAQFAAPKEALPGLLLIFDTEEERDAAIGSFKWPVP